MFASLALRLDLQRFYELERERSLGWKGYVAIAGETCAAGTGRCANQSADQRAFAATG
jgi:hypothetical protein